MVESCPKLPHDPWSSSCPPDAASNIASRMRSFRLSFLLDCFDFPIAHQNSDAPVSCCPMCGTAAPSSGAAPTQVQVGVAAPQNMASPPRSRRKTTFSSLSVFYRGLSELRSGALAGKPRLACSILRAPQLRV